MTQSPVLGCLISGGGRTVLNLADAIADGRLPARIGIVIASNPDAAGIERCRGRGLSVEVVGRHEGLSDEKRNDRIDQLLVDAGVNLVCLCGYLRRFRVGTTWKGHVVNIHPALLPRHGGLGMYGHHVHEAVLRSGDTESGCTVHWVDEQYDHGPTILQRRCPVLPSDSPEDLAERVFEQERLAYPEAIRQILTALRPEARPKSTA